MSHTPPTEAAFLAMVRSGLLMRRLMEPYFARHGISGAQWGVLVALHRAEAEGLCGVRVTDLSDRLLIRMPSVTGVVGRLERLGLVTRAVAADDHRARDLRLTPAGRRLVGRVLDGHADHVEQVMSPLDAGQRRELAALLGRVADHLEELTSADGPAGEQQTVGAVG